MTLQLELWHLITLLVTFMGASAGAGKLLLAQHQAHMDTRLSAHEATRQMNHQTIQGRLTAIEAAAREESSQWQRVERELMSLKADLPVAYVRRDDYIRGQSVLEAKLDGLATKIENAQLRGLMRNPGEAQ